MRLTVQPNYYTKTTGLRQTQQKSNLNYITNKIGSTQVSFSGDTFNFTEIENEELAKRTRLEKFFGAGKVEVRERVQQRLIGFNMAQGAVLDQQKQTIKAKEEATATLEKALAESNARIEAFQKEIIAAQNNKIPNEEFEKLKKELEDLKNAKTQKKTEFDAETENLRKAKKAQEEMNKIKEGKGWDKIAGHADVKKQLEEAFIEKLALEQGGTKVTMPNAILFYGPQSTGKTWFARAFAEQSNCEYVEIDMNQPDEDIFKALSKAGRESARLYESSPDKKRTIILLDECDAIARLEGNEKGNVLKDSNVAKLKNFMQKCAEEYKCTLFLTTNHPRKIDTELLAAHRVPYQVFLGPPEKEDSAAIFKHYLKGIEQVIDCNKLADEVMKARETKHAYTVGQIENIVKTCREAALKVGSLTEMDLIKKIQATKPDISPSVLLSFAEDIAEMGKRFV